MGLLVKSTTLVLGGARSGKSRHAEALLAAVEHPLYVATGEALDEEMCVRIARHRAARGPHWRTVEVPIELARALADDPDTPALVDCLTLWLTNLLLGDHDIAGHAEALLAALGARRAATVLVANEVGLGIVPGDALSRRFRDEAGRLNQAVAAASDRVVFVAAGLPLVLKGAG